MRSFLKTKGPVVLADIVTMFILHGNTRQFWPKIPYLSLRDESVGEHTRRLFSTLALVSVGQVLLGRLPHERQIPRAAAIGAVPVALPALIGLNTRVLRLRPPWSAVYNFALVLPLPVAATLLEDAIAGASAAADSAGQEPSV